MRHESGQNFVFVDGHARRCKPMVEGEEREGDGEGARSGYYREAKLE
jgi:prepilin-type processing-associated H-X9-DG protein